MNKFIIHFFISISCISCGISLKQSNYNDVNPKLQRIIIPYNSSLVNKTVDYKLIGDTGINFNLQFLNLNNLIDITKMFDTTHVVLVQPFCGGTGELIQNFNKISEKSNEVKIYIATTYDVPMIHAICDYFKITKPFYIIDTSFGSGNFKPQKRFTQSIMQLNTKIRKDEPNYFKFSKEGKLIEARWTSEL